ncbi:MAG: 50S ribosomal protein L19e [Halobacteriota archaeon]|uniref:Large ribosomal subunit protein eL19 n=1 Tax=Halodesulfurarchaeum formicicum TaxID=1873524 RepID=A0A1D8S2G2_9EURY|nr:MULTISPECIES: 50S ribosomal protein L19e [Halodesulfurarchaeum]AOW79549.1 50S ribosomal protein L19e [Halodesulfurarchaeum formicicum]APE94800.1 50S ribosomal protein L19e [Halodesulfurarchaeum formicicum]MDR5655829.1 50S ribosomal protein L19e [Halodesulfurarchaeum sp. HSR-GB]
MSDLSTQKRLAADVLDVGENRIWLDPDEQSEIAEAITREDIRELVQNGTIRASEPSGNSRGRARKRDEKRAAGHRKGPGTRKGKAGARSDPADEYRDGIRAIRRELRELRDDGPLSRSQYRQLYRMASGGEFDSVRRLRAYIEDNYDIERGDI